MSDTPTRFAWQCLGAPAYPPPIPKRGAQFGQGQTCWLCGGPTNDEGWPRDKALPSTFAAHNEAAAQASGTVCQPCAFFAVGETWRPRAKALGLKVWQQASWRSYGHFFAAPDHHECPTPRRWREIVTAPPEPPFLVIASLSGQKNLIFRGAVAHSRDAFPVQLEEERLFIERARLMQCLDAVESALAAGASKEAVSTGRWHAAAMRSAGLASYRRAEEALRPWRRAEPQLLALTVYLAQRPEKPEAEDAADATTAPSPAIETPDQPSLF